MGVISETFDSTGGPSGKVVHRSNALISDSKTPNDPPEFRGGALPGNSEGLRKDSADRLSADGANRTEKVLQIWKEDAQGRGYVELFGQTANRDGDMGEGQLLARFSHTGSFVRGLGSAPVGGGSNEFRHPNGIVWFVIQDDGNLVCYQNRVQWDYHTGRPIWWSGSQVDLAQTEMRPRPTPEPSQPAPSQPSEPAEQGLTFRYKGITYTVDAGDFALMEEIFKVRLDASDEDAYHGGRLSWEGVLAKFRAKVDRDDESA